MFEGAAGSMDFKSATQALLLALSVVVSTAHCTPSIGATQPRGKSVSIKSGIGSVSGTVRDLGMADIEQLILALRWQDAINVIDQKLKLDPDNAGLWLRRGYADMGLERGLKTIEDCRHALNDQRYKAKAYCLTGLACRSLGKFDDALQAFEASIKADASQPLAWYGHGITQVSLNNNQEAILDFTKAISLEPDRESQAEGLVARAHSEIMLNQTAEAMADLDQAIEYQPSCAEAFEARAEAQFQQGHPELAMIDAMKATELAPRSASAWYWRGCAAGVLNRHKEALDAFNSSIEIDDKAALSYIYRGLVWVNLSQFDRALQDAELALKLGGPDYSAYRTRSIAFTKLGHYDKALADLSEMAILQPDKAGTYALQADVHLAQENYAKALEDSDIATRLDPGMNVWEYRARALEGLQKYADGIAVCDTQIASHPAAADAYVMRARLDLQIHNLADCLKDADKALSLDPLWDYPRELRAVALASREEWESVVKECSAYLEAYPGRSSMLRRRAIAYSNLKQFDQAEQDIAAAIRLEPVAYNYAAHGDINLDAHKYAAAVIDADKAIELDPRISYAYFVRGTANGKLGNKEQCEKDTAQALALEKEPWEAQSALAYFSMQLGDYQKALDAYSKAIDMQPGDAMSYTWRADAYNQSGQYEKAIQDCSKAIELESRLAIAYEKRAAAYEKLGKRREAQADRGKLEELVKR